MKEYLEVSGKAVSESARRDITEHFRQLQQSLEENFPTKKEYNNWLRNPFIGSFLTEDLSFKTYEQLIDIASRFFLNQ